MYEAYFNLTERPFASVPRIDHYFPAAVAENARNTLIRCIERAEGAGIVVGPSGTGKTLLCQLLAEQFQGSFQIALLAGAHLGTRRALLQSILYELGQPYRGMDDGELRLALIDHVTLSEECGRGVILLVDEAHHLPLRLLDEVRTLTNLMRNNQPAVRLILAGGRGLEERFASPKLESFSQRLAARCYLEPFQRNETEAYLRARILACGGQEPLIFPPETCHTVHKATDGVPRLINQVCDHVMLLGYVAGYHRIEPAHVEEAWADLQQLPTPWNAPAAENSPGIIEFGDLDDEPSDNFADDPAANPPELEAAPTSYRITEPDPAMVDETVDPEERLRHIQRILADVASEFQPTGSMTTEVELVFEEPPQSFREEFVEEELIADRYALLARTATPLEIPARQLPGDRVFDESIRAASDKIAIHRSETVSADDLEKPIDDTEDGEEQGSPWPHRKIVAVRRPEFGRLFAQLRHGS